MVRYTFACRGEPRDPDKTMELDVKELDIFNLEQYTEQYLCDVNKNGEVPVLITENGKPMPESVDITFYFAQRYPSLAPEKYKAEIERRLKQLHDINFFSLTFTSKPENQLRGKRFLQDCLKEDISPRYREAIEHKLKRLHATKLDALSDDIVNFSFERTKTFMQDIEGILKESQTDWCFGLEQPSALDAHTIIFVHRLLDRNRGDLIPESVKQYAMKATKGEAWQEAMQDRRTLHPDVMALLP